MQDRVPPYRDAPVQAPGIAPKTILPETRRMSRSLSALGSRSCLGSLPLLGALSRPNANANAVAVAVVLVPVLVLVLAPAPDGAGAAEKETAPKGLQIGDPAPDFSLPGVDGKTRALKDFAGAKALCILFTCNHCPTAQAYEERIKRIVADYEAKGVALVAISPNDPDAVRLDELGYTDLSDSLEEMKIRAEHAKFNFPYLYDGETQKVSRAYGPTATPHAFVFDAERKLRYAGRIDDSEPEDKVKSRDLRNALDALLAGKPVAVERTRTFGCSIKWASKAETAKRSAQPPKPEDIGLEAIDADGIAKLVTGKSDKYRLVNVWATWCGPCIVEFPEIVKLQRMYGHRSFEVVTLSADSPDHGEKVLAFLRKQGAVTRNLHYSGSDKDKLIDAVDEEWSGAIPHTILISPQGRIVWRHAGEIDVLAARRTIVKSLGARG